VILVVGVPGTGCPPRAAERPRVTIQVIPFRAGAHTGLDSRFVIVSTSEDHTPELVHVEGLSGYRNFEKPQELGHYARAFRVLSAAALTPTETRELIAAAIARLDHRRLQVTKAAADESAGGLVPAPLHKNKSVAPAGRHAYVVLASQPLR
jgi:hypothetical protein